jgi:glutamine synthetase
LPEAFAKKLWDDFALKAVVATEIEFYLHGISKQLTPAQVIARIREVCNGAGLLLASVEQERGPNQYEVSFVPSGDMVHVATDTERFKALMTATFAAADFSAKPLPDKPGSGLHVHIHLEDREGQNVFFRKEDDTFSPLLLHAIGGLLVFMNPCMPVFAPTEESYNRITATTPLQGIERGKEDYNNSPKTVSWGTNNRTVAIRLPTKPLYNKHLEHRVAGSDADTGKVIAAILAGVHYGLKNKSNPGEAVYGDASLPQYALPLLAKSLSEAKANNAACLVLKDYF